MKEKKVSAEVLLTKIEGLTELINSRFDDNVREHFALLEQAKRTNGRVTVLESKVQGIEQKEAEIDGMRKGVGISWSTVVQLFLIIGAVAAVLLLKK